MIASLPASTLLMSFCCALVCTLQTSNDAMFVGGVWGPYYSAMLPGKFLREGGQSATGSVVSHVFRGELTHSN